MYGAAFCQGASKLERTRDSSKTLFPITSQKYELVFFLSGFPLNCVPGKQSQLPKWYPLFSSPVFHNFTCTAANVSKLRHKFQEILVRGEEYFGTLGKPPEMPQMCGVVLLTVQSGQACQIPCEQFSLVSIFLRVQMQG